VTSPRRRPHLHCDRRRRTHHHCSGTGPREASTTASGRTTCSSRRSGTRGSSGVRWPCGVPALVLCIHSCVARYARALTETGRLCGRLLPHETPARVPRRSVPVANLIWRVLRRQGPRPSGGGGVRLSATAIRVAERAPPTRPHPLIGRVGPWGSWWLLRGCARHVDVVSLLSSRLPRRRADREPVPFPRRRRGTGARRCPSSR
jgi:hypothetical protein